MATLVNRRLFWATPNMQIACVVRRQNLAQSKATILTVSGNTFEVDAVDLRPDEESAKQRSTELKARFMLFGPRGYVTRTSMTGPFQFTENRNLAYVFSDEDAEKLRTQISEATDYELIIEYQRYRTDLTLGDQVEFREPFPDETPGTVYVIICDPTEQSIATLRGEDPPRVRISSLEMLLSSKWTIKPQQTVNLLDLVKTKTPSCQDGTCGDCPRCKGTLK